MFKVKTNQWFSRDVPALAETLDTEQVYEESDEVTQSEFPSSEAEGGDDFDDFINGLDL